MSRLIILIVAAAICFVSQSPETTNLPERPLSPKEQRGKDIYFGVDVRSDSPIVAIIGNPPEKVAGSLAACESCHGKNGKGAKGAVIDPADISWASLMKPRRSQQPDGRNRPAYTESLIVRAVAMGIDSGGNKLHVAMPRLQMSRDDMQALLSYLKLLGAGVEASKN